MQILGKRSKVLLIVVAVVLLVSVGISFAAWDSMSTVKATNGDLSSYANAKVGDKIEFGNYYQTGNKINGKYEKTTITWIVVDKDERTGQLTLLSEKILACGSYFGNYYNNSAALWGAHYDNKATLSGIPYNQAYVDSTVRAYLNNLERLDMGGDGFTSGTGYVPSKTNSTTATGLLSSIGFSNQRYWTNLSYETSADKALVNAGNKGLYKRYDSAVEIYYQRPINNAEFQNRPATLGFYDEAFSGEEKSMIVPKQIAGYIGHRWPDGTHNMATKSYIEGAYDKIWLPSTTELNITNAKDWNGHTNDSWTTPSDEAGSTVFKYFKDLEDDALTDALKATRTAFAMNSFAMNFSIPVYNKGTTTVNSSIHATKNSTDNYWTRSPSSYAFAHARLVTDLGNFSHDSSYSSAIGVRPCVIIKY